MNVAHRWLALIGLAFAVQAQEAAPLFPFVISYDGPDNASSVAHLLDAPAGRHGFVRAQGGHFVTDAGPIRFHGTNLTGPANFPSRADADKLAARLARFGINCVRLHFMDTWYVNFMTRPTQGILADDTHTQRELDPKQLDRLDYMIAAFKRAGIYVNINLHVGRTLDERDGLPGIKGLSWANKGIGQFEPRMIELQKEYARKLLTHVNPYTGNAYTVEPCVAMIEISNEDSLLLTYLGGTLDRLPDPYAADLRRQWNDWLHETYANAGAFQAAWTWKNEPLRDEQIKEGRFDTPLVFDNKRWSFQPGAGTGQASVENGVLKVAVTRHGGEYFAKVIRGQIALKKGQLYTLSFRIRRTAGEGPWKLSVAIASTADGWRSLGLQGLVSVGSDWKTVTRVFEASEDTERAILQLTRFKVGQYELDDLSLRAGAELVVEPVQGFDERSVPAVATTAEAVPPQAQRDYLRFLLATETRYWTGMAAFIHDDLKARQPVSGTQLYYSPSYIQAKLDYVDIHGYWRHPTGGWISLTAKEPWEIGSDSMVHSLANILGMAGQRVLEKPYTISEYNHPYPNPFGAEAQPMLAIFGRLQGWDGIFQYSYNHYVNDFEPQAMPWCFFDLIARTDTLAHFPACAAIFLRGDAKGAVQTVAAATDETTYREKVIATRSASFSVGSAGHDARLAALHRVGVTFGDGASIETRKIPDGQRVHVSDTGEIVWNRERPGAAYLALRAPNTKLFTGFPDGRTIDLGHGVSLAVGATRLNWATVSLVSRHATGFGGAGRSASILLAATGDAGNTGRVMKQVDKMHITLTDRGHAPMRVEGIPATLTLPADPARTTCYALDERGERKTEVKVEAAPGGAKIVIGPHFQTVWYEVVIGK